MAVKQSDERMTKHRASQTSENFKLLLTKLIISHPRLFSISLFLNKKRLAPSFAHLRYTIRSEIDASDRTPPQSWFMRDCGAGHLAERAEVVFEMVPLRTDGNGSETIYAILQLQEEGAAKQTGITKFRSHDKPICCLESLFSTFLQPIVRGVSSIQT